MKLLKRIWNFLRGWFVKNRLPQTDKAEKQESTDKVDYQYSFMVVDDLPYTPLDKIIYIVGEDDNYWMLGFNCPCGCNELIQLNLLEEASPSWSYSLKADKISIKPSIWRNAGCKSHFFIHKGNVKWANSWISDTLIE